MTNVNVLNILTGFTLPFTLQIIGIDNPESYLIYNVQNVQDQGTNVILTVEILSYGDVGIIGDSYCFNLSQNGLNAECQMVYEWSGGFNGYLTSNNGTLNADYFYLSYTGSNGNIWTNYLTGHTGNFALVATAYDDPTLYLAFQSSVVITTTGFLILQVNQQTLSYSSTNFSVGQELCVQITPIGDVLQPAECLTTSQGIDFGTVEVGDTLILDAPYGISLTVGSLVHIYVQNSPNAFVQLQVTSYIEDDSGVPFSGSVTGTTTVVSTGTTTGVEYDLCFIPFPTTDAFIFRRTLFVDMNGNDSIGASISPVGGILNPPFKTIQAAIDYINTNISSYVAVDVTIHVFAGTYYVSTGAAGDTGPGPIELGFTSVLGSFTRVHLYLEDGVYIVDTTTVVGGTAANPVYLFKLQGPAPSISGYGVIKSGGVVGVNFCDIFRIEQPSSALIQVKRINHEFRQNIGKTFRHVRTQDKLTEVFFEGEVYINNVNGALLHNLNSHPSGNLMSFEFGHNSKITILNNDSDSGTNHPVVYTGTSTVFVRGDWYHKPNTNYNGKIFWYFNNQAVYIFDGADIYLSVTAVNNYFIGTNSISNCVMEVRESTYSNGYVDNTFPITNYSGGFLFQGASIKPNVLPGIY